MATMRHYDSEKPPVRMMIRSVASTLIEENEFFMLQ